MLEGVAQALVGQRAQVMSVGPPAGKAMIILMGLMGNFCCASTGAAMARQAAPAVARRVK
ncbi:hypothetical protein [Ottowia sp.]|uniref:hypothetical protein n=1 Tax=Ottowia sp. TaxID=1898956 RepID=UPI002600CB57|nr:hypothetical protein [Ottowia sp.]